MKTIATLLLAVSLFSTVSAHDSIIHELEAKVIDAINDAKQIPGLNTSEFYYISAGILDRWNELTEKGVLEVKGTDAGVRPYFVAIQAIVEHVLAEELNEDIVSLTGIILTPMPATPLCTSGAISPKLVNPSVEKDALRLFTVNARTTILRDFLHKGGHLYIAYPKNNFMLRTPTQQIIYQQTRQIYPNLNDHPLTCNAVDTDLIGAVYIFKSVSGESFAFAIKMTQANNPQDSGNFGLWFGELDNPDIEKRVNEVVDFINNNSSVQLKI